MILDSTKHAAENDCFFIYSLLHKLIINWSSSAAARSVRRARVRVIASGLCVMASPSYAQDAWLEEIIVTAQKRYETVQEVPIAITAFTGDIIHDIGAQNIDDLGRFTPGLDTNNINVTQPTYTIRGIQTNDFGIGTDPAVVVYIDGVYIGRSGSAQLNFNDIERVEVLRGPQGTLFGRNAAAGAIHIITTKPSAVDEGSLMLTLGNYNKRKIEGLYNAALGENFAARIGLLWNERDGFIDNRSPKGVDELGQESNWSLTGSFQWFNDDTDVLLKLEADKLDHDGPYRYSVNENFYQFGPGGDPFDDHENDSDSFEKRNLFGSALTVNHDINDDLSFVSITSYRTFDSDNREDEDGTAIIGRFFDTHNKEDNKQFSQEFRLSYASDDKLSWSTGVSYFREEAEQTHLVIFSTHLVDLLLGASLLGDGIVADENIEGDGSFLGLVNDVLSNNYAGFGLPGATGLELLDRQWFYDVMENELTFSSIAAYGDMTYSFTDELDVTVGLRYTRDSKDFKRRTVSDPLGYRLAFDTYENSNGFNFLNVAGDWLLSGSNPDTRPPAPIAAYADNPDDEWDEWTPRMVIDYQWTADVMTYLTLAKGFKAGGFNSTGFNPQPFEEEIVKNSELGLKSTWFDSQLRFNLAVFFFKYENLQILELYPAENETLPSHKLGNGDAKVKGLEMELYWQLSESLLLSFNWAELDTEYTDYVRHDRDGNEIERDGQPLSRVPERTSTLGLQYTLGLDTGEFIVRGDTSYGSERVDNSGENRSVVGSYALTNMRVTYVPTRGDGESGWELALYVQNAFDKEYLLEAEEGFAEREGNTPHVQRGLPRLFGLEYKHSF